MSYDEKLAQRTREMLAATNRKTEEKKMFGGLCFMVNGKMCVGVEKERMMVRLDPEKYATVVKKKGCMPMDFTGKVMKGFVFVDTSVLNTKKDLQFWMDLALEYNQVAKPAKKSAKAKVKAKSKVRS